MTTATEIEYEADGRTMVGRLQPNPMWRQERVEDGHVRGYAPCGRAV
jgi:hypothetical protein